MKVRPLVLAGCGLLLAGCASGTSHPTSHGSPTLNSANGIVRLTGATQHVHLRPHTTYGIYIEDKNNSGYTVGCNVTSGKSHRVPLKDSGSYITDAGDINVDQVFNSGDGNLSIRCSTAGAEKVWTQIFTRYYTHPAADGSPRVPFLLGYKLGAPGMAQVLEAGPEKFTVAYSRSTCQPKGVIVAETPKPGTPLRKHQAVTLTVSKGAAPGGPDACGLGS